MARSRVVVQTEDLFQQAHLYSRSSGSSSVQQRDRRRAAAPGARWKGAPKFRTAWPPAARRTPCRRRGSRLRIEQDRTATLFNLAPAAPTARLASLGRLCSASRASPRLAHGNSHSTWTRFGRGQSNSPKRILSDGGP